MKTFITKGMAPVLLVLLLFGFTGCSAEAKIYKEAGEAFKSENYIKVVELLDSIPDYKDTDNLKIQANEHIALQKAITDFEIAVSIAETQNADIDSALSPAQELLDSGKIPFDESTSTALQVAISALRECKRVIPSIPGDITAILSATATLSEPIEYTPLVSSLNDACSAFLQSVRLQEQITNPTGDFIILRLSEIESIDEIQGATEDNDPNGHLNKQGGYTSATFFSCLLVDQTEVYGENLMEKGTSAGGCIEVYTTAANAKTRNDYLAGYDGTILSSGSHVVIGSIVVRTSDELTASQQNELTQQIVNILCEVRD